MLRKRFNYVASNGVLKRLVEEGGLPPLIYELERCQSWSTMSRQKNCTHKPFAEKLKYFCFFKQTNENCSDNPKRAKKGKAGPVRACP